MNKIISKTKRIFLRLMPETVYFLGFGVIIWAGITVINTVCNGEEASIGLWCLGLMGLAIMSIGASALYIREEEKAKKENGNGKNKRYSHG